MKIKKHKILKIVEKLSNWISRFNNKSDLIINSVSKLITIKIHDKERINFLVGFKPNLSSYKPIRKKNKTPIEKHTVSLLLKSLFSFKKASKKIEIIVINIRKRPPSKGTGSLWIFLKLSGLS